MEEKYIKLEYLGKDFNIEEPDETSDLETIYCGKVETVGSAGGPPRKYKNFSSAINFFIITISVLLISGALWGFCSKDWGPFQIIGKFICELIKSIGI